MHENTYIKTKVAKQACMLASSGFLSISFTPVNIGGLSSEGVGGLAPRAGPIKPFRTSPIDIKLFCISADRASTSFNLSTALSKFSDQAR